jgi:hypothetical protein
LRGQNLATVRPRHFQPHQKTWTRHYLKDRRANRLLSLNRPITHDARIGTSLGVWSATLPLQH